MGCRSSAGHGGPGPGVRAGGRIGPGRRAAARARARAADDDRVIHTGFAALDAILGPGGLPQVGQRRDPRRRLQRPDDARRSGVVAEAQAQGSVVAWLDLSRSFDPVEAVARGVRLEWLVVITPASLDEGLVDRGLAPGRPLGRPARPRPARRPTRQDRQAGQDRRPPPSTRRARPAGGDAAPRSSMRPGSPAASRPRSRSRRGLRLELARRSWIRLGRDIVGQRTEALVARNRYGPPGRRATLRILYAEGGERDACLRRDDLLIEAIPTADKAPAIESSNGPTAMRLLHLYRPHLPLELATARASEPFPPGPLVLGGRPWDPGPVIDANPDARALGVRRGMPLANAHRLAPEATFVDPDPEADRAAAEAAFEALAAFSPGLAGTIDPADAAFGLFEVQIDGLGPLWGPEPVLVERADARRSPRRPAGEWPGAADAFRAGIAGHALRRDHRRGPCP